MALTEQDDSDDIENEANKQILFLVDHAEMLFKKKHFLAKSMRTSFLSLTKQKLRNSVSCYRRPNIYKTKLNLSSNGSFKVHFTKLTSLESIDCVEEFIKIIEIAVDVANQTLLLQRALDDYSNYSRNKKP
ncbi:hypothetical protein GJ496_005827 [Pomphorhynchus laevis]|nr:hypothetical protein GJ496_005827 [Pomphorhynchus laevis]